MPYWIDNTPENIRACVTAPPFRYVLTWYRSGDVFWLDRETDESECCGQADSLDDFNQILYEWEMQPLGMGRKGKRVDEKEERQPRYTLTF